MNPIDLRDPAAVRRFAAQSLWLARIAPPRADDVRAIFDWTLELASEGEPLPPLGFIADVGHMIFRAAPAAAASAIPGLPTTLVGPYEDSVLGKLLADAAFERAGDALRTYQGRDRARGLAFLLQHLRERVGYGGVVISPGTLKALRDADANDLLSEGWHSLAEDGPSPLLVALLEGLVREFRNSARLLGPEDVFELERRTAIAQFGQRVALRQVVQASAAFEDALPRRKPRAPARRYQVPTRILEEDTYPVGGFASISTRGSIESLLHSQLAYMEAGERPDLFDIKYLRDELLFYARDENSFLRRRRTFVIALYPDLAEARFKDADLPYQRIVLLLALIHAAVHRLIDWLHTDSLVFEIILIDAKGESRLAAERELLGVLFAESIAQGVVKLKSLAPDRLAAHCEHHARRSLCHALLANVHDQKQKADHVGLGRLVLRGAVPELGFDADPLIRPEAESAWQAWVAQIERLLVHWI